MQGDAQTDASSHGRAVTGRALGTKALVPEAVWFRSEISSLERRRLTELPGPRPGAVGLLLWALASPSNNTAQSDMQQLVLLQLVPPTQTGQYTGTVGCRAASLE